jgi:hypothetical protein
MDQFTPNVLNISHNSHQRSSTDQLFSDTLQINNIDKILKILNNSYITDSDSEYIEKNLQRNTNFMQNFTGNFCQDSSKSEILNLLKRASQCLKYKTFGMGEIIYRRKDVRPSQYAVYHILAGKVGFFESVGELPHLNFQENLGRELSGLKLESPRANSVAIQVHRAPESLVDEEKGRDLWVEDAASR